MLEVISSFKSWITDSHHYDVCKHFAGGVHLGGYDGLSKSGLCVFRELCTVSFIVVGESLSVLL